MEEQTVKCPICGEPYVFYTHFAGDQSACEKCRMKARRNIGRYDSAAQRLWREAEAEAEKDPEKNSWAKLAKKARNKWITEDSEAGANREARE